MSDYFLDEEAFESIHFSRISTKQCRKLHWAALEVLERTGVRLFCEEAVDLLKRAGADISDGNRVRIPAKLVEKALACVPKQLALANRHGKRVIFLKGKRYYFGPGSDCLNIIDHRTGERRKALLNDVIEGTIVCDALPMVDFVMSMVLPSDVNQEIADRYQMEAMLSHTIKPIVFVSYDYKGTEDIIEMGETVAGGEEALESNPFLVCLVNPVTGLKHDKESLQKLLYCAGKRIPVIYAPGARGGLSAPVTPAATTVIGLVGMLTGLVLSQLKCPGSPFIASGVTGSSLDFRTMISPYANPAAGIGHAMIHYYNLPNWNIGGVTDAKILDQQSAAEAALTLMTGVLSGGHLIHDMGYLEQALTYSFPQLVLCSEIASWIDHYVRCPVIDDDTLALNLINEIGPDGDFIKTKHTYTHFKKHWYSDLFERKPYERWVEAGEETLSDRAAKKVNHILTEHQPELLPQDIRKRLKLIVSRSENR